jgi:DNA-binding Xre family transcriptional regulator
MASEIDPSVIRDDQKVDKADLREQLGIARDEITALQKSASYIRRMATSDTQFNEI